MLADKAAQPSAVILDGRTMQSTLESGARVGYDGYKRKKGSKVRIGVATLSHLLAYTHKSFFLVKGVPTVLEAHAVL